MDGQVKPGHDDKRCGEEAVIKIWGRNTSSNVQKVMWAIGEIGLPHQRIDIGGSFGQNREPGYLAMNPNGLVPTLAKHKALEPTDLRERALASKWMDWQLSVAGPAIFGCFWGLIRTPPDKRDHAAIEDSKKKTTAAMAMMDQQLAKTAYLAGDEFSYGDIPVGIIAYRYCQLVPERPPLPNFERWYAAISARQAFKDHVGAVPLT